MDWSATKQGVQAVGSCRDEGAADALCAVFMFGDDLQFFWANRLGLQQAGCDLGALRRLRPWDIKPDYDAGTFMALIQPLMAGAPSLYFHTEHRSCSGRVAPVRVQLRRVCPAREPPYFVALVRERDDCDKAALREAAALMNRQQIRLANQAGMTSLGAGLASVSDALAEEVVRVRAGQLDGLAENMAYCAHYLRALAAV